MMKAGRCDPKKESRLKGGERSIQLLSAGSNLKEPWEVSAFVSYAVRRESEARERKGTPTKKCI